MPATATKQQHSAKSVENGRQRHSADVSPQRNGHGRPFDDAVLKKIVTQSPLMEEVFRFVRQVAPVDSTMLVTGESGTGKELIAEAIHAASARSAGPFLTINMAAVPESFVESALFGHVKGFF